MSQDLGLALMRFTPSAVVSMDTEGRITGLNPAAERLLGTSGQEAMGHPYPEIFGRSLADRMVGLFIRATRHAGAPQLVEATLPDGRRAVLRATAGPLLDAAGNATGILFVAEDRSEVAQATAEAKSRAEKEAKLREALRRYVGDQVATRIDERPSFVGIGGVRQTISVMHADVRGYTTVAEALPPEEVHALLLRYHGAAVAALKAEGGMPDRYVGDAILALWNAPRPQEGHARMALRGALALVAATRAVGEDLRYGAGVHTGEAVVGNLGSEQYMHYTAIGDTVNVAARLQSGAAAGEVICSAATLAAAGEGVVATPLGALTVKGRKNPVEAYRVEAIAD